MPKAKWVQIFFAQKWPEIL